MGDVNTVRDGTEMMDDYFENYEVKPNDLEVLGNDIDELAASQLVEEDVLKEIRYVTYDSKYLYVFTRGEHASNEQFQVEELASASTSGLRIFKIQQSGHIGKTRDDYTGAKAWLLCDEVETTAVGARKFPNENTLREPERPDQPEMILDVVQIAPLEAWNKIQKGQFNYKTDMVFHEAGHIEQRRLEEWQLGNPILEDFPSEEAKSRFLRVVQETNVLPDKHKDLVIQNINRTALAEMYAMVIDSEGAKKHDPVGYGTGKTQNRTLMNALATEPVEEGVLKEFTWCLGQQHFTGHLLVHVLEDRFPDFAERKQFARDCLDPKLAEKLN